MAMVNLTIDGKPVSVEAGTTILEAAKTGDFSLIKNISESSSEYTILFNIDLSL